MKTEVFTQKNMQTLQDFLRKQGKTLTCAESCTGGLIASKITQISGSSDIFNGSIVTYSNEIKTQELGVSKESLQQSGAVSEGVVATMCQGVLEKFHADYALAISGVAGPSGGSEHKPVGTVVIGVLQKGKEPQIATHRFQGSREEIQEKSAQKALLSLYHLLDLV